MQLATAAVLGLCLMPLPALARSAAPLQAAQPASADKPSTTAKASREAKHAVPLVAGDKTGVRVTRRGEVVLPSQ